MSSRSDFPLVLSIFSLFTAASPAGCGDDDGAGPLSIQGPFFSTWGSRTRTFPLSTSDLTVSCKPKPGLGEFTFEAATVPDKDSGTYFRFTIKDYTVAKTYDLEYGVGKPRHEVEVGFEPRSKKAGDKDYHYVFFQALRADNNKTYNSHCSITLEEEEGTDSTLYSGVATCVMLWADTDSADNVVGTLNSYVDLLASFECEYSL